MTVAGGQVSQNRGTPFAQQVGLLGVTGDPRDTGFPQVSTGGLYNTFGDPTVFTTRNNQHVELFDNVTIDRGRHRVKFGGYYFHLQLRPEQPDNARGAFSYTGQFTGNAFADFLLGYPTSAVSGIGRGDENGRTNWLHLYLQDDWQARDNLTFNLGVRYEFNQHMYDVNSRLSSIDLSVPGGRFVIASEDGAMSPAADGLLSQIPIPRVTSESIGWGPGLLDPSAVRLAPRAGFALSLNDSRAVIRGGYGVFLNQWAYSVQTAFARNLPFFFTKQVDVPSDVRVPTLQTRDILTSNATGTVGGSIMDYAYNVSYTLSHSKDDASSPGATESEANVPQNVRNVFDETGEWAASSCDHRHQLVASGTCQLPFGVRANAIFSVQAGAPFTVNLGVDRARVRQRRSRAGQDMGFRWALAARDPLGSVQPAQPRQRRPAQPDIREPELRTDLQRQEPAGDAVRGPPRVLIP